MERTRDLNDSVQQDHIISALMAVTAYYHGTIDTDSLWNGDHPVIPSWYDDSASKPSRENTGFAFSRIGHTKRPDDGVSPEFGGTAARTAAGKEGAQWGNLASMRLLDGSSISIGTTGSLRFVREDRDGSDELTFFLDPDTNPYNGNNVRTLRRFTMERADNVTSAKISIPTDEIVAGKYYIGAQIADSDGRLRLLYTPLIEFTAVAGASVASSASPFSVMPIAPPASATTAPPQRVLDLIATPTPPSNLS